MDKNGPSTARKDNIPLDEEEPMQEDSSSDDTPPMMGQQEMAYSKSVKMIPDEVFKKQLQMMMKVTEENHNRNIELSRSTYSQNNISQMKDSRMGQLNE